MKCVKCGCEFTEGIFCPECGNKYNAEEAAKIERERIEAEQLARERAAREKEEQEKAAREKAEAERIAKEKAKAERAERERQEAEAKRKAEEERIAKQQAEAEKARQEQQALQERTYKGTVYESREEATIAREDEERVESLKRKLLSTKKQDERRKIIAEFGNPPMTAESRQRYDALKAKSEQEKPKSIIINWIYGITVLIAMIPAVALSVENGAIYYVAMVWAGFGIYIWIIWKIVLFVKSKSKKYYLNIKHI